jgi:dTDP-4-dehydrorhamnose reductase
MAKVLILGSSGMLGSSIRKVFENSAAVETFTASRGKDSPDFRFSSISDIPGIVSTVKPDFILNCAGVIKPHIDEQDPSSVRNTIEINSLLPYVLAAESSKINSQVIQIATDCVFDGKRGKYDEDSIHTPSDVYGATKSLGEPKFRSFLNLRCSIVGHELFSNKSLLNWFLSQPKNSELRGFTNHYWNGVTTDIFAQIILGVVTQGPWIDGTYHLVPSDSVSKFELLGLFRTYFSRDDLVIHPSQAVNTIDRRITTKFPEINKALWRHSVFQNYIPTIDNLISTLKI